MNSASQKWIPEVAGLWICVIFFWGLLLTSAIAWEPRYWVWGRTSPVTSEESALLRSQGVQRLYWHFVSLRTVNGRWASDAVLNLTPAAPGSPMRVPVFRLVPGSEDALIAPAARALAAKMAATAKQLGADEAQVDFDCPDRLLPSYAEFLGNCRDALQPLKLSATALAHWSQTSSFLKLQQSVDALYPMFYDLRPDDPAHARSGSFEPMLGVPTAASEIDAWGACKVPWYAGLPGFARVTIFDALGKSRGHLHTWDWDDLAFERHLSTVNGSRAGLVHLRAQQNLVLAKTPIAAGESVLCRWPPLPDLSAALLAAQAAGAAGVAVFRLPEQGASGGWSLRQWTALHQGKSGSPKLRLLYRDHMLQLMNASENDLPPRLAGPSGPMDRGWQLEIEDTARHLIFREASAGDFAAVFGHAKVSTPNPQPVGIAEAERLTFWFSALPAATSRRSGLISLARDAEPATLRWRVTDSSNEKWQSIEISTDDSTDPSSPP